MPPLSTNVTYEFSVKGKIIRPSRFKDRAKKITNRPLFPKSITVNFYLSSVVRRCMYPPDDPIPIDLPREIRYLTTESIAIPSSNSVADPNLARASEVEALTAMGIPESEQQKIVPAVASEAASIGVRARDEPQPISSFRILVSIMLVQSEIYDYYEITAALMDSPQSMFNFQPACASSIQTLERGDVGGSGEACVICLEDISCGHSAVRMPCKHVYHEDCIVCWLRVSHFCPVCRYPMPVEDN